MSRASFWLSTFCAVSLSVSVRPLNGELRSLDIFERSAFADGTLFGETGSYNVLRGVAHFEVDPRHLRNRVIVDLERAPKNSRGMVSFEADVFILAPVDLRKGNKAILYGVNNRGGKNTLRFVNSAQGSNSPRTKAHAGNGFLFRYGYTVVWCGWIGELLAGNDKLLLRADCIGGRQADSGQGPPGDRRRRTA